MRKQDIDKLSRKIDEIKSKKNIQKNKKHHRLDLDPMSIAFNLVAGVLIGIFIGIYLDKFFQSKPLFLIVSLFLGIAGGVRNLFIKMKKVEKEKNES